MKNYDLFSTFMPWRESGKSERRKLEINQLRKNFKLKTNKQN